MLRKRFHGNWFGHPLDAEALANLRLAVTQSRALGNERYDATIERMMGERR